MPDFSDQNVFEMCVANGGPGFWVRRTTWEASCAHVVGVGQFTKPGPYFGNPPVVMDVYNLKGELKDELTKMSVPGTYKTWRKIDPPTWAEIAKLRSLTDPAIEAAVKRYDRRTTALGLEHDAGRVFLSVSFARKEEAKRLGAHWSPLEKRWWVAVTNEDALLKAREAGFL